MKPENIYLGGISFKGYKHIENKSEGNENKIILGYFNCTKDKMVRDGGNKRQSLYRWGSNYALSQLTVGNWFEDLWRRKNPDSSEFTHHDRSSGTGSRLDRVYTDIKIVNKTKINYILVSFTDHYNAISLESLPSKTKIGKDYWYFNNSFLCKREISSASKNLLFY